jgi:hypothetical protein
MHSDPGCCTWNGAKNLQPNIVTKSANRFEFKKMEMGCLHGRETNPSVLQAPILQLNISYESEMVMIIRLAAHAAVD